MKELTCQKCATLICCLLMKLLTQIEEQQQHDDNCTFSVDSRMKYSQPCHHLPIESVHKSHVMSIQYTCYAICAMHYHY
jgi:hypothetical protein